MAESKLEILLKLRDDASKQLEGIKGKIESMSGTLRKAGIGMVAAGGAITGVLAMATKAALEEDVGIRRLTATLGNVGTAYADVRKELEANIAATQNKTNYGDEEQRDALSQLLNITGQYTGSLDLLSLATDVAAANQIDLATASMLVGRTAIGDTTLLKRYGIVVAEGATATEALAQMQERYRGVAEASVNPITQITNLLGDLSQDIGSMLLPVVKDLVNKMIPIIQQTRAWIELHPSLVKSIVTAAGAIGSLSLALGTMALVASTRVIPIMIGMVAAIWSYVTAAFAALAATGPAGWVLALTALATIVTGITLLVKEQTNQMQQLNAETSAATVKTAEISQGFGQVAGMAMAATVSVDGLKKALSSVPRWFTIGGPSITGVGGAAIFGEAYNLPGQDSARLQQMYDAAIAQGFMEQAEELKKYMRSREYDYPSYANGGIVPGLPGQPVPVIAHGGERFLGVGTGANAGNITVNVYPQGSVIAESDLASFVRQEIIRIKDRNYSSGL